MSVKVNSNLIPRTVGYSLVEDKDVKGGLHTVANTIERNAIPDYVRKAGMLAYVIDRGDTTSELQQLGNNLLTWTAFGSPPETLAAAYLVGTLASNQTLVIDNAHGNHPIFSVSAVNVAQVPGLALLNPTIATLGAQKYSPMLELAGKGWQTDAGGASANQKIGIQNQVLQGTASAIPGLFLLQSNESNGSAGAWGQYGSINPAYDTSQTSGGLYIMGWKNTPASPLPSTGISLVNNEIYFGLGDAGGHGLASIWYYMLNSSFQPFTSNTYLLGQANRSWLGIFQGNDSVGASRVAGVTLSNLAAASAGYANQSWSPGLQLTGQQWDGTASVPVDWLLQHMSVTGQTHVGALSFSSRYNNGSWAEELTITPSGAGGPITIAANRDSVRVVDNAGSGFGVGAGLPQVFNGGVAQWQFYSSYFIPLTDLVARVGLVSNRLTEVWSRVHAGVHQDVSSSGVVSIDTQLGEMCVLTSTANISSITLTAGVPAQLFTLQMTQGNPAHTWPTAFANSLIVGGTFTKTTTAGAIDTMTWRYNATSSKWEEISRSLALV